MSFESARAAIESYFETQWAGATPISFENDKYKAITGTPYVRIQIVPNFENQITVGGEHRYFDIIKIDIFTVKGTGTKLAVQYKDSVTEIFRGKYISGTIVRDMTYSERIPYDEWIMDTMMFETYRDETA